MKANEDQLKQINDLVQGGMKFVQERIAKEIEALETTVANADFAQGFAQAKKQALIIAQAKK
jgi:thiamine monophosphate synthase